ncbi:cytoplasmic protein [Stereum hirsutum FP-91666 SS1]|uniref:cytoplasmic protein n=1 Tax=Stereum hirsutum (strain FP-91666) TaxID=721885 RepID=UPI000440B22D|nr:cytoplasmic protein [Stereum hirsutum FP-91666 SS1]EIM88335.1 cytoplasmic protein [Stereum hirsutum FP-91666 SS1]
MAPQAASSSRALQAILPLIASGQAYEAHQKARTFASRYQKSSQYDTAIDVLFQSARELLKAGQQGSGTDLTVFLLDVYDAKGEKVGEESRGRLTQLIALTGSEGTWRKTIIDKSVVWSAKHGIYPAGDPDLHHYIGELLYKEGVVDATESHLLAAGKRDSARVLAHVYVDWAQSSTDGVAAHAGSFGLRGTIPYLLNGNILAARIFLASFLQLLPLSSPPLQSPIQPEPLPIPSRTSTGKTDDDEIIFTKDTALNFVQLAVRTCQRAQGDKNKIAREAWVRLCGTYQSRGGILAAPDVRQALNEIATVYFAIPPPRTQQANPFGDIMSSLFGGPPSGVASAPTRRAITPGGASGGAMLD